MNAPLENNPLPCRPKSERLDDYLAQSDVIDWRAPTIAATANQITAHGGSEATRAKHLFEWVRDNIPHSCDAGHQTLTCRASDVLRLRTGMCFAKSHLLVALFRSVGIPAGFCYQWLRYNEQSADMTLHGLCAVHLKSLERWIRIDPRGNKPGVDAQFQLDREQLAFPTNPALGEEICPVIFAEPLPVVVQCLTTAATAGEALSQLLVKGKPPEFFVNAPA
ncbi:MAG: transglutaminase family protein, partial [Thermoguttaceae bacterium]